VGLVLPTVYANALEGRTDYDPTSLVQVPHEVTQISRGVAIILIIGYLIYVFYQTKSHDSLLGEIFEADELKDADRHRDLAKDKLTMTECIIALFIGLACVTLIAVFLVMQIEYMVTEKHISDAFIGLIMIPLVEKLAGEPQYFPNVLSSLC
jgi:Ca2+:H+ antiporter